MCLKLFISILEPCTTVVVRFAVSRWDSRLQPGFNVVTHQSTMLQINVIPHPCSHLKLKLG